MAAVRIYDPELPNETLTGDQVLWEAGQILTAVDPDERRILFAQDGVLKPFTTGTVTAQMLALELGQTVDNTRHVLNELVAKGVLVRGDMRKICPIAKRRVTYWRKVGAS